MTEKVLLSFLLAIIHIVSSTQNGLCNDQFCVCSTTAATRDDDIPDCPEWMTTKSRGGPYDSISSRFCDTSSVRASRVCEGNVDAFFQNVRFMGGNLWPENGVCQVDYLIRDGSERIVVDYNQNNPVPPCPSYNPLLTKTTNLLLASSSAAWSHHFVAVILVGFAAFLAL